jgi:cytochrome c-type biogenesis protein CcmH
MRNSAAERSGPRRRTRHPDGGGGRARAHRGLAPHSGGRPALQKAEAADSRRGAFDRWIIAGGLVAVVAGSVGVYFQIGAPGYPDLPLATRIALIDEARATRPAQADAEAQVTVREAVQPQPEREALVAQLRTIMEQRPDDAQGLALLASNEAALGNFRAARLAQGRLIDLLGERTSPARISSTTRR